MPTYSWLTFAATGETLADVVRGRWQSFESDEAAQASTVYQDYAFAVIADSAGGTPRLQWTQADGWTDAE